MTQLSRKRQKIGQIKGRIKARSPILNPTIQQLIVHMYTKFRAIGRAPDSLVRGPGFDTRSGNILSFLLPLFQEGQLSVTGESMCTKYWLTA